MVSAQDIFKKTQEIVKEKDAQKKEQLSTELKKLVSEAEKPFNADDTLSEENPFRLVALTKPLDIETFKILLSAKNIQILGDRALTASMRPLLLSRENRIELLLTMREVLSNNNLNTWMKVITEIAEKQPDDLKYVIAKEENEQQLNMYLDVLHKTQKSLYSSTNLGFYPAKTNADYYLTLLSSLIQYTSEKIAAMNHSHIPTLRAKLTTEKNLSFRRTANQAFLKELLPQLKDMEQQEKTQGKIFSEVQIETVLSTVRAKHPGITENLKQTLIQISSEFLAAQMQSQLQLKNSH